MQCIMKVWDLNMLSQGRDGEKNLMPSDDFVAIGTRMVGLGDKFPDFTASTTLGEINFQRWAAGKWVYLFNLPAVFGLICSGEIMDVEIQLPSFRALDVQPIGIAQSSLDSITAWTEDVHNEIGFPVTFPIVADPRSEIDGALTGEQPQGKGREIRKSFLIDPDMRIQFVIQYPIYIGRNLDEPLRVVAALGSGPINRLEASLPA